MAITTNMGLKKPEGTDTFASFVADTCANLELLESEINDKADGAHTHFELKAAPARVEDSVSVSKSITAQDNTEYFFGTLGSLAVLLPEGNYEVYFRFTAGANMTVTGFEGVLWRGEDEPDYTEGCVYEISIRDGFGVYGEY